MRRWIWLATGSNMHMIHKYYMLRPSEQFLVTCFLRPDRIEQVDPGGIGVESHDRSRGIQYTDFRSLRAENYFRVCPRIPSVDTGP